MPSKNNEAGSDQPSLLKYGNAKLTLTSSFSELRSQPIFLIKQSQVVFELQPSISTSKDSNFKLDLPAF